MESSSTDYSYSLLAASSGVSRDFGWAWQHSLDFCLSNKLKRCQIYLGQALFESSRERQSCADAFYKADIALSCHSPGLLQSPWVNDRYFAAFHELLEHQEPKKVVVHHDGFLDLKSQVRLLEAFNQNGLLPCLENYYQEYTPKVLVQTLSSWSATLGAATSTELALMAVIDLPRLYLGAFQQAWPGDVAASLVFASLAQTGFPLILHCIDCDKPSQDRASWCPLGTGIVPHKKLYEQAGAWGIQLDHLVLEYEDPVLLQKSLGPALCLVNNFHVP